VRADHDLAGPRCERERHSDRFAAFADHDCFLVARLIAVAIRANVDGLAIAALESGDVRPDIPDPDREQNAVRLHQGSIAKPDREELAGLVDRLVYDSANVLDAVLGAFLPADGAQLRGADAGMAEVSVDGARFPVTRITRIHHHYLM